MFTLFVLRPHNDIPRDKFIKTDDTQAGYHILVASGTTICTALHCVARLAPTSILTTTFATNTVVLCTTDRDNRMHRTIGVSNTSSCRFLGMTTEDFITLEQQANMVVAVASPSTSIQENERGKMEATVYDAIETTYLTVTHTTNAITNDNAVTVIKKRKKMALRVLSVAAACAAVLFAWGVLVSLSSSTAAIAETGVALEGVANYPKVTVKNKTNRPASVTDDGQYTSSSGYDFAASGGVAVTEDGQYTSSSSDNNFSPAEHGKKTTHPPTEGLVATTTSRFDVVSSSSFSSVSILNGSDPQATRKVRPVMITNVAHSSYPSLYLL